MLLLEARHIEKSYGDRVIFRADKLEVMNGDRIGIVGPNGAGKTTLLMILSGEVQADSGTVSAFADCALIRQLELAEQEGTSSKGRQKWGVSQVHDSLSGGEHVRLKIASALERQAPLLFADEPTSHLDLSGIRQLEESLDSYPGAVLLISHDRELLNTLCTRIWEVEHGAVTEYKGNYSAYRKQKEQKKEREWVEYDAYQKEKKRLIQAVFEKKQHARSMKDAPKRMSNSEAKLHKMQAQGKREKVEQSAKALESRLAQLEEKEKPKELARVQFDLHQEGEFRGRTAIHCNQVKVQAGSRTLFTDLAFRVQRGQKVALIGANGSGKSTLLSIIAQKAEGISVSPGIRLGYFNQTLTILDQELSILQNVKKDSRYPESTIRTALARLLFQGDAVHKQVSLLSGGERVKVALAKVFFGDYHVLLLDEPTNYLDIPTQEELELLLADFPGAILFATHDRKLMAGLADAVLSFDEPEPLLFSGGYQEYQEAKNRKGTRDEKAEQILLLETRLTDLISRLSVPTLPAEDKERLDREYEETLTQLQMWKRSAK
ncbi:ribosomal protection-like ABC-F family protein [Brevibacillus choshinensis]|uniref:ABC-F type ribosomal protection protein n=1 Tax=Brevibacillus choshinensis TaxID=54911 RepID=A0ABX7FQY5_BRECH|nr:ABC-F type ribosomal protection protein [Brevibacillus choshinensis]QRG67702.1 ABC-F type ribosomal protection protein [Brevibacillus choshinensis]